MNIVEGNHGGANRDSTQDDIRFYNNADGGLNAEINGENNVPNGEQPQVSF